MIAIGALFFMRTGASAAPAPNIQQEYRQPDGSTFIATLRGDEYFSYLETEDGSVLVRDENGSWCYGTADFFVGTMLQGMPSPALELRSSAAVYLSSRRPAGAMSLEQARQASSAATQAANAQRMEAAAQYAADAPPGLAPKRTVPVLVVLVDFNDAQILYENQWANRVFGVGTNSVRDYYREATAGVVDVVPVRETYGIVNDGVVRVHAGVAHPNTNWTPYEIVKLIMGKTLPYVNYHAYDTNGNGSLDRDELNIIFVMAGYEMGLGGTPGIWGHADGWVNTIPGIYSTPFAVVGERHNDIMATIGVICHELGHSMLNLYDLYATSNLGDSAAIAITLMGSGNWITDEGLPLGSTPARFDPFSLVYGRIVNPTVVHIDGSFDGNLRSVSTGNPDILKVIIDESTYYLIDNRQYDGYDRGIPAMNVAIDPGNHVYRFHQYDHSIPWFYYLKWVDSYANASSRKTILNRHTNPSTLVSETGQIAWFAFEAKSPPGTSMRIMVNRDDSVPTIVGPNSLTLAQGYAATSTNVYTIKGIPAPIVTKISGDAKITWNNTTKRLSIAAGLAQGTYPVVLRASNGIGTGAMLTFTLTVGVPLSVDKTALNTLLTQAKAITKGNYTDASWNALQSSIAAAQAVIDNGNATQTQIDAQVTALQNAISGLIEVNKAGLNTLLAQAKAIVKGNYMDSSWNALQAAIAAAQAVADDGNATQAQVAAQIIALQGAIDGLAKNPLPSFAINKSVLNLDYRGTAKLSVTGAHGKVTWSSNNDKVSVDQSGLVTSNRSFLSKSTTATITASDEAGRSVTCAVNVTPTMLQRIIAIFLFGWIWL